MTAPRARALRGGVLAALVVVCLLSVLAPLSAYVRQQADLAALGGEVDTGQERVDALNTQVARWQDPAYVSAQARARLNYVMPGETGYVVLDAATAPSRAPSGAAQGLTGRVPATASAAAAGEAWYGRLWGTVEEAGR